MTTTAPAPTTESDPAVGPHPQVPSDPEFRSFSKAVLLGIVLGILGMAVAIGAAVKLVAPETSTAAIVGIAVWVGVFCGPFLAGTITVGLSSRH